ncbi:MAG: hypothetical protein RIT81_38650 [Deltaproteobacteria bacterium]
MTEAILSFSPTTTTPAPPFEEYRAVVRFLRAQGDEVVPDWRSDTLTGAGRSGEVRFDLPTPAEDRFEVLLVGPSGQTVLETQADAARLRSNTPFSFEPEATVVIPPADRPDLARPVRLAGWALEARTHRAIASRPVTIVARRDEDGEPETVFRTATDVTGYFYGDYPVGPFVSAEARVGSSPAGVALRLDETGMLAPVQILVAEPSLAPDEACCDGAAPRLPDREDLVRSPGAYSADTDGSACVSFHGKPDRTLEEVRFTAAVRVTQPTIESVANLPETPPAAAPAPATDAAPTTRTTPTRRTTTMFGAPTIGIPTGVRIADRTDDIVATTDPTAVLANLELLDTAPSSRHPDQPHRAVEWMGGGVAHQATSIAHGHLLRYKQSWHADGYSLGDLLYSLPLAPAQKKRIAILDWDRRERGRRGDEVSVSEELKAELARDRDVREVLASVLGETSSGGSRSRTKTVSATGGIFGLGYGYGGFLGASGGYSKSSSRSWERSARDLGTQFSNRLVDRTMQAQGSLRRQRATVVQTVGQDEEVVATTEVIANHNHCHAMTVQYFEVLRHFVVRQELESVEECLFVPLRITRFGVGHEPEVQLATGLQRALRHREALMPALQAKGFARPAEAFAAARRLMRHQGHKKALAERAIDWIEGDLSVDFRMAKPRPGREVRWLESVLNIVPDLDPVQLFPGWALIGQQWQYNQQRWGSPTQPHWLFPVHVEGLSEADSIEKVEQLRQEIGKLAQANASLREEVFVRDVAPKMARRFLERVRVALKLYSGETVPLDAALTLQGEYKSDSRLPVRFAMQSGVQSHPGLLGVSRSEILGLAFYLPEPPPLPFNGLLETIAPGQRFAPRWLPEDTQVLLRSGTFEYRPEGTRRGLTLARIGAGDLNNTYGRGKYPIVVSVSTPSREETVDPAAEDFQEALRLWEHLNANLAYYHRAMWANMADADRFMLLDSIEAPNAGGRSVAQVVRNEVVGIVGNNLVMPVAPGLRLNPQMTYGEGDESERLFAHYAPLTPPPPVRFTLPTSGVFAEAIMGACNACEIKDESRFWRWEEVSGGLQPTPIEPLSTASRRAGDADLTPVSLPQPIVQLQNAPAAPAVAGVQAGLDAITQPGAFRDIAGQAGTIENAARALSASMAAAQNAASLAAGLQLATQTTANLDRLLYAAKDAPEGTTENILAAAIDGGVAGAVRGSGNVIEDVGKRALQYAKDKGVGATVSASDGKSAVSAKIDPAPRPPPSQAESGVEFRTFMDEVAVELAGPVVAMSDEKQLWEDGVERRYFEPNGSSQRERIGRLHFAEKNGHGLSIWHLTDTADDEVKSVEPVTCEGVDTPAMISEIIARKDAIFEMVELYASRMGEEKIEVVFVTCFDTELSGGLGRAIHVQHPTAVVELTALTAGIDEGLEEVLAHELAHLLLAHLVKDSANAAPLGQLQVAAGVSAVDTLSHKLEGSTYASDHTATEEGMVRLINFLMRTDSETSKGLKKLKKALKSKSVDIEKLQEFLRDGTAAASSFTLLEDPNVLDLDEIDVVADIERVPLAKSYRDSRGQNLGFPASLSARNEVLFRHRPSDLMGWWEYGVPSSDEVGLFWVRFTERSETSPDIAWVALPPGHIEQPYCGKVELVDGVWKFEAGLLERDGNGYHAPNRETFEMTDADFTDAVTKRAIARLTKSGLDELV